MRDAAVQRASTGAFDGLAEAYDRFRTGYAPELYDALFDYGLATAGRVLDLATGTGLVAHELTARGCSVTGVDVSAAMLERARARVPAATFEPGRAEALPFETHAFDGAVCAQAFHWFERRAALAELERVVRPGGVVAVWWKSLMRGDAVRHARAEAERAAGVEPLPDLVAEGFPEFEASALADRRLRVIPWLVHTTVADFLGYERSRARPGTAYGDRAGAYLAALAERLGEPGQTLTLSYLHYLYLGRVAENG